MVKVGVTIMTATDQNFQHMPTAKADRNGAIFALYNAGCAKHDIASAFDLSITRVTNILNRCEERQSRNKFLSVRLFNAMLNHGYDLTGMNKDEAMPMLVSFRDKVLSMPRGSIPNFGKKAMMELNTLID
jgi:hypothetical protein